MFTRSPSNRRPGAPYGNTNAKKHGLTIRKYRSAPFQILAQQQAEKLTQGTLFHRVSPLTENDSLAAVFALGRRPFGGR